MTDKRSIRDALPLALPVPCPICGSTVYLRAVTEWETDSGAIVGVEYDCETEPDIDSDEWWGWHHEHFRMPYVDWLPWETNMLRWLNDHYHHEGE